jgi:hypothetical protein
VGISSDSGPLAGPATTVHTCVEVKTQTQHWVFLAQIRHFYAISYLYEGRVEAQNERTRPSRGNRIETCMFSNISGPRSRERKYKDELVRIEI